MEYNDIKQSVEEVISEFAKNKNLEEGKEYDLKDIITDSLDLMRFLVGVEEKFDIYIDQQYLLVDKLDNKNNIIDIVAKIISEEEEEEE